MESALFSMTIFLCLYEQTLRNRDPDTHRISLFIKLLSALSFDANLHSWFPCLTYEDIALFTSCTSGSALEKMCFRRDACIWDFLFSSGRI